MAAMLEKLKRTELQALVMLIALALLNHFLAWGIDPWTLIAMALGTGGYAVSRGLAKTEVVS